MTYGILKGKSGGAPRVPPPCASDPVRSDAPPKAHVIVYDLEIQLSPDDVGGWENVRRGDAGVSCVVLYDNHTERFHIYQGFPDENGEHDLEECVNHLNQADVLVSFNGIEFDTPVLQSITGMDVLPRQYDILHEVWKSLPSRVKGYRLADICERLELGSKTFSGATATQLYADGRFGKLFDYCLNDVALTRKLARWIYKNGWILTPDGERLELPKVDA